MAQRRWVRGTGPHWLSDPITALVAIVIVEANTPRGAPDEAAPASNRPSPLSS
jgi:hypothetical protein